MLWHKAQGAGGAGGDITGELIEFKFAGQLVTAPQAGDLLVGHVGSYTSAVSTYSPYTQVIRAVSSAWSGSYTESSNIVYKIATGSEGTNIMNIGGGSSVMGVYRFSSPVTSVSVAFSTTQQGFASKTIDTSSYDKPHIVVCTIACHGNPSIAMTNSDYALRGGYSNAAASLRNPDSSLTSAVITMTNTTFNEACSYAVLVPNF
mgnify:CR=1 FL=1|jgi:hypothetical protein|tara:strand:+ start:386 stop:997 length:612 start_codon:yes stop_codon:yes gene_type:complete